MECKNCHTVIAAKANFCSNCGGKVITETITLKFLILNFLSLYIGWDNRYLQTVKFLILKPEILLKDYLGGVRRRYVDPFVFLTIGAALSLFVFNSFLDEYIESQSTISNFQIELMDQYLGDKSDPSFQKELDKMKADNEENLKFVLKYFNVLTFLFIPLYGFMSYLVFGKSFRYGEHLVINSYVQGFTFLTSILFFFCSIYISPSIFLYSIIFVIFYYLYVYGRLLKLGVGKLILKLLKFFLVLVGLVIVATIVIGVVVAGYIIISKTLS